MLTLGVVLTAIVAVFAVYTVLAPLALNYGRFGNGFRLPCPERNETAKVDVNAAGAAISSAYGLQRLHMRKCSLLSPGDVCDEACLKGISA
jgi:hypothetical protein